MESVCQQAKTAPAEEAGGACEGCAAAAGSLLAAAWPFEAADGADCSACPQQQQSTPLLLVLTPQLYKGHELNEDKRVEHPKPGTLRLVWSLELGTQKCTKACYLKATTRSFHI